MLVIKQKLIDEYHNSAYSPLAIIDAFTTQKVGKLTTIQKHFKCVSAGFGWGRKIGIVKYMYWRTLEDLTLGIAVTAIPTAHFLTRAQLVAETAYLKLCNETEHIFSEDEMPVWCAQYIRDNLFEVSTIVLRSCGEEYTQKNPIRVAVAEEGTFKSSYSDTIHSYLCLEVHFKN